MVVVGVSDDEGLNVGLFRFQVADVRNNEVDAGGFFFGELEAGVNNNNFVFIF